MLVDNNMLDDDYDCDDDDDDCDYDYDDSNFSNLSATGSGCLYALPAFARRQPRMMMIMMSNTTTPLNIPTTSHRLRHLSPKLVNPLSQMQVLSGCFLQSLTTADAL